MEHLAKYRPYLPALTTLTGAVIVAGGLLFDQGSEFFRFMGASIASIGAFWSAHRQIVGAAEKQEKDQTIIRLSEQLYGYTTGGDSFCFAYPISHGDSREFHWTFVHQGQFPLIDVSVRVCDLAKRRGIGLDKNYNLGTIFPGRAHDFAATPIESRLPSHGYNLFFLARNGSWTQEIRWVDLPDRLSVANRVLRDGTPRDQPLLLEVSPSFPDPLPEIDPWNAPPPYGHNGRGLTANE